MSELPIEQQAGYDAVNECVREWGMTAWANARVWKAVEAYRVAAVPVAPPRSIDRDALALTIAMAHLPEGVPMAGYWAGDDDYRIADAVVAYMRGLLNDSE